MFSEMRRAKQKLSDEKTIEILKNCDYGVLSTCGEDGQSYGVPLNYAYEDNKIFFHCAMDGMKLRNIAANKNVCFTVTAKAELLPQEFSTSYESVIAMGKASFAADDEKLHALKLLIEKYSPGYMTEGLAHIEKYIAKTTVIKIEILNICGKYGH